MVPRVGMESCNYHFTFDNRFVCDTVKLNSVISGKSDYWPAAIFRRVSEAVATSDDT
jgi:hypothetical protein